MQRTKSSALKWLVAGLLMALSAQTGTAETTANTFNRDKAACLETSDNVACESAYDFLHAEMEAASEKTAGKYVPDLKALADTGCAAGNGWLCTEIGNSHKEGIVGRAEDDALALKYHLRACDLGNGLGCARAGMDYRRGRGVEKDAASGERLLVKGCRAGSPDACQYYALAKVLDIVASTPETPDSVATMQEKCKNTGLVGTACVELGNAYYMGDYGLEEDEHQARIYWGKACARAVYAPGCTLRGLLILSETDMEDRHSSDNLQGIQAVYRGCLLGDVAACEFMVVAGEETAWNYDDVVAQGLYGRCLSAPTAKDCQRSGDAFKPSQFPDHDLKGEFAPDKALRAWMIACREFNVRCVEAANLYLGVERFTDASPNLAIGVLETACDKGDAAACARRDEVVAETGGVSGSYIDPMLGDDERFLLARFDIESGDTQRGRETMQWLAFLGHPHAQLYLAYAYDSGLGVVPSGRDVPHSLMNKERMIYDLFEASAQKGVPEAAMRAAVFKYYENDHEGSDSYEQSIGRALYLGADGAQEFYDAAVAQNKALTDARLAAIREMNRQNIESRDKMNRETVESAWDQYYKRQKEREALEGGQVCGTVYGEGNSTYRTCMSRSTAMKYYRGNF